MSDDSYINHLHDRRRRAFDAARAIVADAHDQRRADLDSTEEQSYQRAVDEVRELDEQIAEWVRRDDLAREHDAARANVEHIVRPGDGSSRFLPDARVADDLARVFSADRDVNAVAEVSFRGLDVNWTGRPEVRSVGGYVGAGTLGGLVPTINRGEIYQTMIDVGAVFQFANVVNTDTSNPVRWPKATAYGSGSITAELGTIGAGDPTLATITTAPFGYKWLIKTSHELLTDSSVDMVPFITDIAAKALAQAYSPDFATGSGTGAPQGYTVGGSVVAQAGGTATPDQWMALKFATNPSYQNGARYVTNNANLGFVMRYRTDGGGTLGPWMVSPPSAPRALSTFAGHEIVIDQSAPAHGSAVKSLAFIHPKAYICHAGALRLERSDQRYFDEDAVGFRTVWPLDGRVIDNKGVSLWQATSNG